MRATKKALFFTLILLVTIIHPFLAIVPQVQAEPIATVDTSTNYYATAYGYQRKSFHAEGLFWAFYSNGTNAGWEFSADGTTWEGAFTNIGACMGGRFFSVWFDGTYVHYVRIDYAGTWDTYYRRGTPVNDGSINWSIVEQIVHDGDVTENYQYICIAVDTNGYAWIGARYFDGLFHPVVLKNDNNDGTWALDFAYELSAVSNAYWRVCPVPLTDGKVYVIYCRNSQLSLGQLYDGDWDAGEENDLADFNIENGYGFSAVALGDNVHFVYNRDVTYQVRHNKRVWGVGWDVADVLVQDAVKSVTGPALSADPSTGDLYCFWTHIDTDHVYLRQYTSGVWQGLVDWIDESTDDIITDSLISSYYMDYGEYIGLLYITELGSPYKVRFTFLDFSPRSYTSKATTFSIGIDGAWTDYDLFTLQGVPKGRVAEIVCANKNIDFARVVGVRTDGSTAGNRYIDLHEAEGDGVTTSTMFVKCNETTGLIECYSEIQGDVDFYLLGYFNSSVDFTESITSLGQPDLAWADLDLTSSGVPDDAVVQILMGNEADANDFFAGVRANESSLGRGFTLDEAEADGWSTISMIVQSDANAVIEWKGGSATDITMWLLGWFSSNINFTEGFTDYSPAVDNTWTSKTIAEAPANSVVALAMIHQDTGSETFSGLREENSILAQMIEEHEAEGGSSTGFEACITIDTDKKLKVYCEDASEAQFTYTGYFTITPEPEPEPEIAKGAIFLFLMPLIVLIAIIFYAVKRK